MIDPQPKPIVSPVSPGSIASSKEQADGSGRMFDAIASRYDAVNRVISFGLDRRWRRLTIDAVAAVDVNDALDLATGTADLALALAKRFPSSNIVGLDPSSEMLRVGQKKVDAAALSGVIKLVEGDAQSLSFKSNSFDAITMGFGIRNVPDRLLALQEMRRVCRPGGRIAILELAEPGAGPVGAVARFHVHQLVPRLGAWLSSSDAYRYLHHSIAKFPSSDVFAALMAEADLEVLDVIPLAFGVAHIFVGTPRG